MYVSFSIFEVANVITVNTRKCPIVRQTVVISVD